MPAIARPQLDPVTISRGEQYALRTNRSLPNAIARLVDVGWQDFMDSHLAACFVSRPPAESKLPLAGSVTTHLSADNLFEVRKLAAAENRSVSSIVNLLVADGLERRKAQQPA